MLKEQFINSVMAKVCNFVQVEEARKIRNILECELYNYELQPASKELVPINSIQEKILLYLAVKKLDGLSDVSLMSYKQHLMRFARFMQKDITQITTMDIRVYLAAYSRGGQKKTSINTEISILKSFFSWLETEEYISKSPMRKIKNIKIDKKVKSALTPEELELLRDSCQTPREKALVEFFYSTGCRLDEVYKLNKDDIQWQSGTVIVAGKGNKERPVYLNAKAKIQLMKYLQSRNDSNEALFVTERKPYNRLGHRSIQRIFRKLGERAGIQKVVHPHLIRHTTATNMLRNGASLSEVQHYLGHDDPATTQIYIDFDRSAIKNAHNKYLA